MKPSETPPIDAGTEPPAATPETPVDPLSAAFVQSSSVYQEFLAERREILRHKWLESEKAGRDIGFERSLLDWVRYHRDAWRAAHRRGPE